MNALPFRFSHFRAYGRSGAHGQHARQQELDPTYAMERGSAVHGLVTGTRKVVGYPGAVRRGKEYEAFAAQHAGSIILTGAEYDKASGMAEAVLSSQVAKPYLQGAAEQTLYFRWMGLNCRATPDINAANHLTELKTSASAEPVKFTYHALRMAYHAQMRLQQIACEADKPCFIVCVEASEPYPVTVFEIDRRTLEIGEKLLVLWAERAKSCEASESYPPYTTSVFPLVAPEDVTFEYEEAA